MGMAGPQRQRPSGRNYDSWRAGNSRSFRIKGLASRDPLGSLAWALRAPVQKKPSGRPRMNEKLGCRHRTPLWP